MLTLLVADTSLSICGQMQAYCEGLRDIKLIKCVSNGLDAYNVIKSERVDILLMDTILPVLDGLGLLIKLEELEVRPAVFVYTAFPGDKLLYELQKCGCEYCFVKPMDPEGIIHRMLRLLSSRYYPELSPKKEEEADDNKSHKRSDLVDEITRQIRAVGLPAHLNGYHYLRDAIYYSVVSDNPSTVAVTKDIYPHLSKQFNKRPQLIERAIRNAIEVAWMRGNTGTLYEYFGYTIDDNKGKPTNAEFIAMIADRVRIKINY